MSEWVDIPFARMAYQARSPIVASEKCENLYLEQNPQGANGQVTLYGTPGLKLFGSFGDGPIRGMHAMGPDLFVVSGQVLYVVGVDGASSEVGTIPGTGAVQMVNDGFNVAIVTGGIPYYSDGVSVAQYNIGDFTSVAYQDGYAIFVLKGSEDFYIAGPLPADFTTISGLDFSNADTFADRLVGAVSDHRELWLFGETTIEIWQNTGNAAFPFERAGAGFIERGCVAAGSIAKADNAVFWLGDDLRVYTAQGYTPQVISPPGIVEIIESIKSPQAAQAHIYSQGGHTFYMLTFAEKTLGFDVTTGLWHTRKSEGMSRWRVANHEWVWQKNLAGDYSSGNIYELDLDTYDENGSVLRREAVSPILQIGGNRAICDAVEFEMEAGVGLTTGQGSDPQIMVDWSDDGGRHWSHERTADIGKIGKYADRAKVHRCGAFYKRLVRLVISDPVKTVIVRARARIEALAV